MLYFIRHGQTGGNAARQLQGRADNPLNELGIQQAREAGERLSGAGVRFSRVYTSPLVRAVDTGSIVAPGVPQIVDERLIEMDYGPYEGMSIDDPAPEVLTFFKDFIHKPAPDGMEQLSEVIARMGRFLEDVRDAAMRQDILVSTHAIAMKGGLEYLTPDSGGSYWNTFLGNCEVYLSGIAPDGSWIVPSAWYPRQ